jgi:hypothetical protein
VPLPLFRQNLGIQMITQAIVECIEHDLAGVQNKYYCSIVAVDFCATVLMEGDEDSLYPVLWPSASDPNICANPVYYV